MSYYASLSSTRPVVLCSHCSAIVQNHRISLTRKQAAIIVFLRDYIATKGFAPSFEEIAAQFGYSSLATVHEHLTSLQRKGWISRAYNTSRSLTILGDASMVQP